MKMLNSGPYLMLLTFLWVGGCALFTADIKEEGRPTYAVTFEQARMVPKDQIVDAHFSSERPETGTVQIIRDNGLVGSGCTHRVYVDGIAIADLEPREKIVLFLPIGEHLFGSKPNGICGGGYSEARGTVRISKKLVFRVGSIPLPGSGVKHRIIAVEQ
jgi:hypothetical protein